jgi:predicted protein tyrosine phosphatase
MKVFAMSRLYAERVIGNGSIDHAVISITDPKSKDPIFKPNPFTKGILFLKFYDIDFSDGNYTPTRADILKAYGDGLFNDSQAREILEFVEQIKSKVKVLICHCEAGVSRSAGVAAAISKILTGSDKNIFDDKRYIPNMFVYRKILNLYFQGGE